MFLEDIKIDKILCVFNSVVLIIITIMLAFLLFKDNKANTDNTSNEIAAITQEEPETFQDELTPNEDENSESSKEIYVDIKGAVKNPGVYKVTQDNIINDVIKLAGGLKSNASTKYTNLSKKVSNEMVITIFTTTQVSKITSPSSSTCVTSTEDISLCPNSSIVETSPSQSSTTNEENTKTDEIDGKVSLNNANKEELMTLTGIGEAKAEAIIEYRTTNNGFKTLEEIMNISGIGEKAYEKIKDNIKL